MTILILKHEEKTTGGRERSRERYIAFNSVDDGKKTEGDKGERGAIFLFPVT